MADKHEPACDRVLDLLEQLSIMVDQGEAHIIGMTSTFDVSHTGVMQDINIRVVLTDPSDAVKIKFV